MAITASVGNYRDVSRALDHSPIEWHDRCMPGACSVCSTAALQLCHPDWSYAVLTSYSYTITNIQYSSRQTRWLLMSDDFDWMRWAIINTRDWGSDVLTRVRSAVLQSWQIHCQLRSQCSHQCCSAAVHLCSLQSVHFAACSSSNDRYLIRSHLNQPSYDEVKVTPSQTHT